MLHLVLRIEVFVELRFGDGLRNDPAVGHLDLGGPEDRVEDEPAEIIDRPVAVPVAAGETDAASAVRTLDRPHHRLAFAEALFAVGSPVDVAVDLLPRWHAGDNVLGRLRVGEAHVVIPLVVRAEAGHAEADGVTFLDLDPGGPVGVGGVAALVVTADPLLETLALLAFRHFDGVMHAHDPDALGEHCFDFRLVAVGGMARVAVGVDHDGLGSFEDRFIRWPTVVDDLHLDGQAALLIKGAGEEDGSRVELMLPGRVTLFAGDEDDLRFLDGGEGFFSARGEREDRRRHADRGDDGDGRGIGEATDEAGFQGFHDRRLTDTVFLGKGEEGFLPPIRGGPPQNFKKSAIVVQAGAACTSSEGMEKVSWLSVEDLSQAPRYSVA